VTRSRNARRQGRLVLVTVAVALAASACSFVNTSQTNIPLPLGDGTSTTLDLSDGSQVKFENFLVVSNEKGGPGTLAGAIETTGGDPVTVALSTGSGSAPVTVDVKPGELVDFGSQDGQSVTLPTVDAAPGGYITMTAGVQSGGTTSWLVPVMLPQGYLSTLAPTAVATTAAPSPSPTDSASASPSPTTTP